MCPKPDGGKTITANITTAQALAAYRDELRALNFPEDTVDSLVREAAHETVRNRGLVIHDPEPLTAEDQGGNGFCISEDRKVINYLGENYYAEDNSNAVGLANAFEDIILSALKFVDLPKQ